MLSVATLRRIFAAVEADFDCVVRFRGAELDRLLDERHAATSAVVATPAAAARLEGGGRGQLQPLRRPGIDRPARLPGLAANALVVEVKTEIASAEETMRRLDVKARLGAALALDRFGERPLRVVRLLAVVDSTANRSRVARLDPLFGPAFPLRGVPLRRWLETPGPVAAAPGPAAGGLLFVSGCPEYRPGHWQGRISPHSAVWGRAGGTIRTRFPHGFIRPLDLRSPGGRFAAPGLIFRDEPARQER